MNAEINIDATIKAAIEITVIYIVSFLTTLPPENERGRV